MFYIDPDTPNFAIWFQEEKLTFNMIQVIYVGGKKFSWGHHDYRRTILLK